MLKLDHVVIHVSDWERSNAFYAEVLGAEVVPHGSGFVYRIGGQQLNVHGPGLEVQEVARLPVQPGNSDLCFQWDGSVAEAQAYLAVRGVEVISGPVRRPGAGGEGQSVYFYDPDGSLLEFISYQEDK
ncbi:biphenyl-2,3-diol 1,2-dioxygenase [Deinococcus piscis]|uniref:Biphenyl-2,3-diol 1,2-dioxygenase n=1 Tax=Deinococcus piscis TaxID=394230 RepID=A0ABQ3KA75_9DEIO|nr:VOC family protein [Deinococcus piscis]GHG06959.1 biphenyl-2,3-diol 1,2-dioxygenase [Deinococcus piscis]